MEVSEPNAGAERKKGNGGPDQTPPAAAVSQRRSRQDAQIFRFLSYLSDPVEPERQSAFVNNFPYLVTKPLDGYDILIGERVRYHNTLRAVARAHYRAAQRLGSDGSSADPQAFRTQAGRRGLWEFLGRAYRRRDFDVDYRQFEDCVKRARATMQHLLDAFFSEQLRLELEMTADVENADDPYELLKLCSLRGDDLLSQRTRFEAARQLLLAQVYLEMCRDGNSPEELDVAMRELDTELMHWYFMPGSSACYEVAAELDPDNEYRVKRLCCAPHRHGAPHLKSHESLAVLYPGMRFIPGGIPVLYQARIKQDAPLKQVLKNRRDTLTIRDLLGIKFIFLNKEDLLRGVEHLRRTVVCVPGTVYGEESNLYRSGVVNETNRYSSEEFRATTWHARILDRRYEIQIELIDDWINERCSSGPENHILYKTHANLVELFPKLFPANLYLVWSNPDVRLSVARLQVARIWS